MFLNRRVSPESILCFLIGSFLDLFLIDNTSIELVFYNVPIRFKTFLNKGVLLKSIFCFLIGLFFTSFKCF